MSKSERSVSKQKAPPGPVDEELGFDLDEDEIDLDLPDWPGASEAKQASDTNVILPAKERAKGGAHAVRAEDLEPLGDSPDDDFDLPLPGQSVSRASSSADSPGRSRRQHQAKETAKAQDGDDTDDLLSGLDIEFDLDMPGEQATDKPQATGSGGRSKKQQAAAKQASRATQTKTAAPARSSTATATNGAKSAPSRAAPAAAPSPSGQSASPRHPSAAATPELPADPGYDVLPADGPVAARPRNRWRKWVISAAGVALVGGLAWLGTLVFGGNSGPSRELDPYELARTRAASRARPNPGAVESKPNAGSPPAPATAAPATGGSPAAATSAEQVIEIGVAYGTEKRNWLEFATQEFAASEEGRRIRVQLIPMGSLESAHAILEGDQRIHVWSPASSLYRESLLRDWEAKYQGSPILKEEALALTPMVLVMWKARYQAFTAKCPNATLRTFNYAMRAAGGWATIAGRPAWGRFKFGHTHPNQSNSGLMTLIILAYEFFGKKSGLTVSEIMSQQFQDYLTEFRAGVAGVSNSTGTLMKEMALKGPTSYDALLVYENLAIEYAESAEGRWDSLQVIYPEHNLWNENPYCILNTPWTTAEHQQAAEKFLAFLLSEPIQARALDFGFRPANPRVPVKGPNSPFAKYAKYGLAIDLPATCDVPAREVIENLQQSWIRCGPPQRDSQR